VRGLNGEDGAELLCSSIEIQPMDSALSLLSTLQSATETARVASQCMWDASRDTVPTDFFDGFLLISSFPGVFQYLHDVLLIVWHIELNVSRWPLLLVIAATSGWNHHD
jgi:hypothetical protein